MKDGGKSGFSKFAETFLELIPVIELDYLINHLDYPRVIIADGHIEGLEE